jgi:UDP-glucuronate 4-epimerase
MMRDFTYIDDIIDGTMAGIKNCAGYNIYNLGESRPVTVNNLIAEIEKALGKKAIIEQLPLQPGDVERTYANVTKAHRDLGYNPHTEISDGLKRFVEWLRH